MEGIENIGKEETTEIYISDQSKNIFAGNGKMGKIYGYHGLYWYRFNDINWNIYGRVYGFYGHCI